jgi:enoyl-CoA hydratase
MLGLVNADRSLVRVEIDEGLAVLILDDAARRNALGLDMTSALAAAVDDALSHDVGAIVLSAEPPVFCSGGSLDDLLAPRAPLRDTYAGFLALAGAPVPTIAAVNGPAIGAGVNLPLACDVTLCSPAARFDPRFLDVGIAPGGAHFWRLARRIGRQGAAALVLCGEALDGRDAERAGLAWRCVDADELLPVAIGLARKAASRPRELVRKTKAMMRHTIEMTTSAEAFEAELELQDWSMHQPEFKHRVDEIRSRTRG